MHPGTGYHRPSGSSIGGSFSGGMPAGFPGGGGGSSGLAAMLAAQQGFGFSGPGLGPRGHLDQGGHGSQPGSFARVSGPQPVQGIVNPFAAANRGGGGGTGVGSGSMPSGSGSGASMMNAALGIGGSSGAQFNSRGGASQHQTLCPCYATIVSWPIGYAVLQTPPNAGEHTCLALRL